MKHRTITRITMFACTLFFSGILVAQGVTWRSVSEGGPLGAPDTSQSYYMPGMIKVVNPARHDVMIIRIDKEMMIHMDTDKETYYEMSFADLENMMKEMNGAMDERMAKMKEEMASMSEEQRKMMEGMMARMIPGGAGGGKLEFKRSDEKKTISGYPCTKFVVLSDGEISFTMWVTKNVDGVSSMIQDMRQFGQRMAAMMPRVGTAMMEGMKNLDGFPIQTEIMGITSTVSRIEKKTSSSGEFEVPANFKKVKPEGLERMKKMNH